MNNLPIHEASDLTKYIIEKNSQNVVFKIPYCDYVTIDAKMIFEHLNVSCITEDTPGDGFQYITLELMHERKLKAYFGKVHELNS